MRPRARNVRVQLSLGSMSDSSGRLHDGIRRCTWEPWGSPGAHPGDIEGREYPQLYSVASIQTQQITSFTLGSVPILGAAHFGFLVRSADYGSSRNMAFS